MPTPLEQFLKVADKVDADKTILAETSIKNTVEEIKNFGENLGKSVEKLFKSTPDTPPKKPANPTPTYQESAFLEPKQETTLYDVTNRKAEVPEVTKNSNIFKKISYSFQGFTASANYKNGKDKYRVFAGEKIGIGYEQQEDRSKTTFSALYNVDNHKSSLNYSYSNPTNSYGVSLFNKNGNNGASAYYSVDKFKSSISIDQNSASANCSYTKKYEDCTLELNTYITTGNNYSNPYGGIGGRVTF